MERTEKIWDFIIQENIANEEELKLVTCINGYREESLNDVIYTRTAYHSMEQYKNCELGEETEEETESEEENE